MGAFSMLVPVYCGNADEVQPLPKVQPAHQPLSPRINGASVVGNRPGTPFIFTIPATGQRPMEFTARGLPDGLVLDAKTGIITGRVDNAGEYQVAVRVRNTHGEARRTLRLVIGERLALTPPMGYNTWNVIERDVSDTVLREMADAMVNLGLRDVGYQYINMDDWWAESERNAEGRLDPDPKRFPQGVKPVADYIHSLGLRFGLYSSPGPKMCAGSSPGTLGHEAQDARIWAGWGVDYLKHDRCSCPKGREIELYSLMGRELACSGRSIVYSIGAGAAACHQWGALADGHLWRTAGDIRDTWTLPKHQAGIIECFEKQRNLDEYQQPGAWNDPDLLVIGIYGKGRSANDLGAAGCNDVEYRSQMSLWSLLGAPLLASCDLRRITPAALEILSNPEVIDIDQDPLGKPARPCAGSCETEVWVKDLEDGSKAVGLLNRGPKSARITAKWVALGLSGKQLVRDLWARKDVGLFDTEWGCEVASRETIFLRISPAVEQAVWQGRRRGSQ